MRNLLILMAIESCTLWACSEEKDIIGTIEEEEELVWEPGMPYHPYPGMPEEEKGVEVYILVQDGGQHALDILEVLNNEAWPSKIRGNDEKNLEQVLFPVHPDIKINVTDTISTTEPNPQHVPCDIVNCSFSSYHLDLAKERLFSYENTDYFSKYPLVITSAGNGTTDIEPQMWDSCLVWGGLSWEDHVLPNMGWKPGPYGTYTEEQYNWFNPGDVGAVCAVQNMWDSNHAKDWIVVGTDDKRSGNRPGPLLKERFICSYYSFDASRGKIDGTSFSTPFVVKIAAEIKRRAPHYTNDEIAQLIFSTADDLGEPGCDDVYGWGRMNPAKIWAELERRGL